MTKTTIALVLASAIVFRSVAAMGGAIADPVCGDVNDSGTVNTTDALQVLRKGVGQPVSLDCSAYDDRIASCEGSLSTCTTDLSSTNADLVACSSGALCGDAVVNSVGEHCDGKDLGGADCASLGYITGTLGCDENCRFDASDCTLCPPGSHLFQGSCWLLGAVPLEADGSCDAACESIGLACSDAALQVIGTDESCRIALDAADPGAAPHDLSSLSPISSTGCGEASDYAIGCTFASTSEVPAENGALRFLYEGSAARCDADYDGGFCATPARRVCACTP